MTFKELARRKINDLDKQKKDSSEKKDKVFYTPVDKAVLKVKKGESLSKKEQNALFRNGFLIHKDGEFKLTKSGMNRLKALNENILLERFRPDEPAPKSKVEGGYESFVSYLDKNGIKVSKRQIKRWFDSNKKKLQEIEKSIRANNKIRSKDGAYWATVRRMMQNHFK